MPQLPRYDSQRAMSTQAPGVMRDPAMRSVTGKMISKAGEMIFEGVVKWKQAQNTMRFNQAKADYDVASSEIYTQAQLDPDYKNSQKYIDDLRKAKDEAMSAFEAPQLREKYGVALDRNLKFDEIKIQAIFRKKELDFSITQLERGIEAQVKKAQTGEVDPAIAIAEIDNLIDANIQASILSRQQGKKAKEVAKEAIRTGRAEYAIWKDPQAFLDALPQDTSLTPEEKIRYEGQAITLRNKRAKDAKTDLAIGDIKGAMKLIGNMLGKTLTPQLVQNMIDSGEISPKTAKVFFQVFEPVEEPDDPARVNAYIRMMEELAKDRPSAMKVIEDAVEGHTKKILNDQELGYFLRVADKMVQDMERGPSWISRAFSAAGGAITYAAQFYGNAFKSFFTKLADGTEVPQAVKEVQQEAVIAQDPTLQTAEDPIQASYEKRAIQMLKDNGYPLDKRNIDALVTQIKIAERTEIE